MCCCVIIFDVGWLPSNRFSLKQYFQNYTFYICNDVAITTATFYGVWSFVSGYPSTCAGGDVYEDTLERTLHLLIHMQNTWIERSDFLVYKLNRLTHHEDMFIRRARPASSAICKQNRELRKHWYNFDFNTWSRILTYFSVYCTKANAISWFYVCIYDSLKWRQVFTF